MRIKIEEVFDKKGSDSQDLYQSIDSINNGVWGDGGLSDQMGDLSEQIDAVDGKANTVKKYNGNLMQALFSAFSESTALELRTIEYGDYVLYTSSNSYREATQFFMAAENGIGFYEKAANTEPPISGLTPTTLISTKAIITEMLEARRIFSDWIASSNYNGTIVENRPNIDGTEGSLLDLQNGLFNFGGKVVGSGDSLKLKNFSAIESIAYFNADKSIDFSRYNPWSGITFAISPKTVYTYFGADDIISGTASFSSDYLSYLTGDSDLTIPIKSMPKAVNIALTSKGVGLYDNDAVISSASTTLSYGHLDGASVSMGNGWYRYPFLDSNRSMDVKQGWLTSISNNWTTYDSRVQYRYYQEPTTGEYMKSAFEAKALKNDGYTPQTQDFVVIPGEECLLSFFFDLEQYNSAYSIDSTLQVYLFFTLKDGSTYNENEYVTVGTKREDVPFGTSSTESFFDESYFVFDDTDSSTGRKHLIGKYSWLFVAPDDVVKVRFCIDVDHAGDVAVIGFPCFSTRSAKRVDINSQYLQLRSQYMTIWSENRPKVINPKEIGASVTLAVTPEAYDIATKRDIWNYAYKPGDSYTIASSNPYAASGYFVSSGGALHFSIVLPLRINSGVNKITASNLGGYIRYGNGGSAPAISDALGSPTVSFRSGDNHVRIACSVKKGYTVPVGGASGVIVQINTLTLAFAYESTQ